MPSASLVFSVCVCVESSADTFKTVAMWSLKSCSYMQLLPGNETMNCFPMSSENICRFALIYPNVSNKTVTPWQTCPSNPGVFLTKTSNYQAATVKELSKVDLCLTDRSKIHHALLSISPFLGVGPSWLRRMGRMQRFFVNHLPLRQPWIPACLPAREGSQVTGEIVLRLMPSLWCNSSRKSFQNWPACIL